MIHFVLHDEGGSVVHTFPTGQGNVIGNPILPVIKLCGSARTVRTMKEHIDLDVTGPRRPSLAAWKACDSSRSRSAGVSQARVTGAGEWSKKSTAVQKSLTDERSEAGFLTSISRPKHEYRRAGGQNCTSALILHVQPGFEPPPHWGHVVGVCGVDTRLRQGEHGEESSDRRREEVQGELTVRRRRSPRVVGPFEAIWRGTIAVPLVIHDLSVGGCLILASDNALPTERMIIDIRLPGEGWITVDAEPLHVRIDYGFAVKFVNLTDTDRQRLRKTVALLAGMEPAAIPM